MRYQSWAEFCRTRECPNQYLIRWASWRSGKSRPTLPRIDEVAQAFSVDRSVILMAAYGIEDDEPIYKKRKDRKKKLITSDNFYRIKDGEIEIECVQCLLRKSIDHFTRHRGSNTFHRYCKDCMQKNRRQRRVRDNAKKAIRQGWIRTLVEKLQHSQTRKALIQLRMCMRAMRAMNVRLDNINHKLKARELTPWEMDGCKREIDWRVLRYDNWYHYQQYKWRQGYIKWKSRQMHLSGSWTYWQWIAKIKEFDSQCAYCNASRASCIADGHDLEADHIFALNLGSSRPDLSRYINNYIDNIVPACKSCNSSKCDEYIIDWLRRVGCAHSCNPLVHHYHQKIVLNESRYVS